MGIVYVTYLKTGSLPGQATGSQGRHSPFMGHLRQRIGLVHELGKLVGPEERVDDRRQRLGIDQVGGRENLVVTHIHPFPDGPGHAGKTHAELVHQLFSHGPHPPVTQVVDIVHIGLGIDQLNEVLDDLDDIPPGQHPVLDIGLQSQFLIEPVPPYFSQIISLIGKEKLVNDIPGCRFIRRFSIPELPVDVHHSLFLRVTGIFLKGIVYDGKI